MNIQEMNVNQFLDRIQLNETKVMRLIAKSNLTDLEKRYIMDHVLIVPGKSDT